VPFEEVVVERRGSIVGRWACGEFGGFADWVVVSSSQYEAIPLAGSCVRMRLIVGDLELNCPLVAMV
jgi:hypothetical protein